MTRRPTTKVDKGHAARLGDGRHRSNDAPGAGKGDFPADADVQILVDAIGEIIHAAQAKVAMTANAVLTTLHWQVGHRIHAHILHRQRAEYAAQIVSTVSRQLATRYGRGFSEKSLRHMIRFAEAFPDFEIVSTVSRELSWSHIRELVYIPDALARDFYLEMCRIERWSVRVLRERIDSMLYERTAISKKPEKLIRQELSALRSTDEMSPLLVFRDPYMLEFLDLANTYSEKDLEAAILRDIERFLLELGATFAFVARQMRITLDGDDYYIDLVFFHRRMRRLVVIELKIGDFKPADAGQMELYLRWLDRHERISSEQSPLGVILCAGKNRETVEYLNLDDKGIHVAEYITEMPPREVLEQRLRQAIDAARSGVVPPRATDVIDGSHGAASS